jgi:hypothetical protein
MLRLIALALSLIGAAFAPAMAATEPVTEEVDAYLYFYPIVTWM